MDRFDLMARDYDTDKRMERSTAIADEIRKHLVHGDGRSAIEYGCGTGLVGFQLADAFKALLLVDSSAEMIRQVEQKIMHTPQSSITALCADFMINAPVNVQVDYVFSSLALHHIKDTAGILRRLYDVLRETGHLLLIDLDKENGHFHANYPEFDGHNGFDQSFLIALAKKIGFTGVEAYTFYWDSKPANGKENPYSLFILDAVK